MVPVKTASSRGGDAVVQFSVFTPNRVGRLNDVVRLFASDGVHVLALTVLDTTDLSPVELRDELRRRYAGDVDQLVLTVTSFGFARGISRTADLVFDMRYLDNPHWDDDLRELTGLDPAVGDHVRNDPAFASSFNKIRELLLELLPRYAAQGKSYVNIAFGCTGGRHRSVFVAEEIAKALREAGFSPTVRHRNLGSRAAELIEGTHQP